VQVTDVEGNLRLMYQKEKAVSRSTGEGGEKEGISSKEENENDEAEVRGGGAEGRMRSRSSLDDRRRGPLLTHDHCNPSDPPFSASSFRLRVTGGRRGGRRTTQRITTLAKGRRRRGGITGRRPPFNRHNKENKEGKI